MAVSCKTPGLNMEKLAQNRLCLSDTSEIAEKSIEDAKSPKLLAKPLRFKNTTASFSEASQAPSQSLDSSKISTKYRSTSFNPEFLDLTKSLGDSKVELSTEAELRQDQDLHASDDLEEVKLIDSVDGTDLGSLFTIIGSSSNPSTIRQYQIQQFERFHADGTSEKFFGIISNDEPIDSAQPLNRRVHFFGDVISSREIREELRRALQTASSNPPNLVIMRSLFTPKYSTEELSSGKAPSHSMTWELGFNTHVFGQSLRLSPNKTPILKRYNMSADKSTFDTFLTADHRHSTEKVAWNAISFVMNPELHQAALTPGFEKLATDFFAGRELQEDYTFAQETRRGASNHVITYHARETSEEEYTYLMHDSTFIRFMIDLAMCNDMEESKRRRTRWNGAMISMRDYGYNKDDEIKVEVQKSNNEDRSLSSSNEAKLDSSGTSSTSATFAALAVDISSPRNMNVFNHVHSQSGLISKQNSQQEHSDIFEPSEPELVANFEEGRKEEHNNESNDKWMNENAQQEKTLKNSSKKGKKSWIKGNTKRPLQASPELDGEPGEELPILENAASMNKGAERSQDRPNSPLLEGADSEGWSLVQNKPPPRQSHPSNGSSVGENTGSMGGQYKLADPLFQQNHPGQSGMPNTPSGRSKRHSDQNAAKSSSASPTIHPNTGTVSKQKLSVNQPRKKSSQIQKPATKDPQVSRTFIPEEYPALASKGAGSPSSPSTESISIKPAHTTTPEAKKGFCLATPTGFAVSSQSGTKDTLNDDIHTLDKNKAAVIIYKKTSPFHTIINASSESILASNLNEKGVLDGVTLDGSLCDDTSQLLPELEAIKASKDVEHSEDSSSIATQAYIALPTKVAFDIETSRDRHRHDDISTFNDPSDDETPSWAENVVENKGDDSEGCEYDSDSDVEIFTSPSQLKHRVMSKSSPALTDHDGQGLSSSIGTRSPNIFSTETPEPTALNHPRLSRTKAPRSNTHSSSGVKIPNFYYIPSDDEDSEEGKNLSELKGEAIGLDSSLSEFQANFPLHDSSPTQDSTYFYHTEPRRNRSNSVPHYLHYSSRPPRAPEDYQLSNLDRGMAPDPGNSHEGPTSFSPRHPMALATTPKSGGSPSSIRPSQLGSQQGSSYWQPPEPFIEGSSMANQKVDPCRDPRNAADTVVMHGPVSYFTANCTYCKERTEPSTENPQVLCAGCGPSGMTRYCSVACLLVDSFYHSGHCLNYPASDRAAFHALPRTFIYILNPIVSDLGYLETSERFRQRAFSMLCSSGSFPKLNRTWMKKSGIIELAKKRIDLDEAAKRTGHYVVFRSDATSPNPRNNPNAEVIYTITFHHGDPLREMLNRALNACYLIWDHTIIEFLYRLIRHMILDPQRFATFKYSDHVDVVWHEFNHQFKQEFNFDSSMQRFPKQSYFNAVAEWPYISAVIANIEHRNPVLSEWFNH